MNTMTYKGYTARVGFDEEDEVFTGRVLGVNDVIGFHAESVAALKQAFHEAIDDYVETCAQLGKPPEKAFSGRVMFRIAPDVHAGAALAAERGGKSLNQWAEEVLASALRSSPPPAPPEKAPAARPAKRPKEVWQSPPASPRKRMKGR